MHIHSRAARINADDVGDLQAAFDALPPAGGVVYLPAGVYGVDRTVTVALREKQHVLFRGDGRATAIHFEATDRSPFLDLRGVPESWWPELRITISGLSFMGNHDAGDALRLQWPNDALVDACFFQGFGGTAVTVTPQATNVTIRDCWMRDCRRVLHADNLHHLTFHGNQCLDNAAHRRRSAGLWEHSEATDLEDFAPLHEHLLGQPAQCTRTTLTFGRVARILDGRLPDAARTEPSWWNNAPTSPQARAWLAAGWLVIIVRRIEQRVVFARIPPA